jgi:hypothetical protein
MTENRGNAMSAMRVGILEEDIPDHWISLASLSEPSSRNSKFDPTNHIKRQQGIAESLSFLALAG